ncbi:MAG TPA: carboxyl transferase domain-containing protein, partial [Vicinamibacteria bacterium]
MGVLSTRVDTHSAGFQANREGMLARLVEIEALLEKARAGGGEKYVARHRARGKLLPRERIELLLDRDSPFLELSPLAANGTEYEVGAAVVTGLGVVSGVECVVSASDPTVRGGATNPYTLTKTLRAMEIARKNRLPLVNLVESAGADLGRQAEIFVPGGAIFKNLTQLSAAGIPTVALVFGSSTAGGAYLPAMCDHTVMVEGAAKVFLGGPPLVKMATGEESDEEELGGASMHSRVSGLSEFLARDERECLHRGREIVARLNWRKRGPGPSGPGDPPLHDPDELLGIPSLDLRVPFEIREVIARVVDGSRFDEWKALYGPTLVTGWAEIHGFPVGILANNGVLFSEESNKAAQFIQLANRQDVPLLFVQNTTGYIVGKAYEQRGIIKDGARMINAVSNSTVPHITLMAGGSYGAGNYGMCGRAYDPRFLWAWPNSRIAVMGGEQAAGVLAIVQAEQARARGVEPDRQRIAAMQQMTRHKFEVESSPYYATA